MRYVLAQRAYDDKDYGVVMGQPDSQTVGRALAD
ncbi:hypothetical protein X011_14100 [Mycobacterium tuberculosis variant microti OV254]|nr:hypothetical protein X011_14100 [Mycobacterium tuberculosis variant microti OV254]